MRPTEFRQTARYPEAEGANSAMRLCLRGTFIDMQCEADEEEYPSPRALSDPGSEISSGYSSHFAKERAYIENLSHQVTKTLSKKDGKLSRASTSDHGRSIESSEDAVSRSKESWQDGSPYCHARPPGELDVAGSLNFFRTAPSSNSSDRTDPSFQDAYKQFLDRPIMRTENSERSQMNQDELRNLVCKKTFEIKGVLRSQRLSTALTSIHEIPEQIEEVFQQSATNLCDEVQGQISVARDLLVNNESYNAKGAEEETSTAEKAAQSMTLIPDMIMASFESSFAKAMSTVRIRVDDVIQGLEGSNMDKEQVVKQMWSIPEEVRQITRDAVKSASQESRDLVVEQLDCVLQSFSAEECMPDALLQAKRQIVARVPKKLPDTLRKATEAAEDRVCRAVKVVQAKTGTTGVVANRVVADTLLRSKMGPSLRRPQEETGLESLRVCCNPSGSACCAPQESAGIGSDHANPGSIGHPELCSRACLYFPLGKCTNGTNCAFCHETHSKRATHLDKRHREMLRSMDFAARFRIIHPILKSKLDALEVNREVGGILERLLQITCVVPPSTDGQATDRKKSKETRTLQVALKFMSVRSLLTLLHHAPEVEGSPQLSAVEEMLQKLRPESYLALREDEARFQSPRSLNRSGAASAGSPRENLENMDRSGAASAGSPRENLENMDENDPVDSNGLLRTRIPQGSNKIIGREDA